MAEWKLYEGDICPSCTKCGMNMPFARYKKSIGINGHYISNYCPYCGAKMEAIDECKTCEHSNNGNWQDNGICFACRSKTWIYKE